MSGHACAPLTADTITDAHLTLILQHARPGTPASFYAWRALHAPRVRFYRTWCAQLLNELAGKLPS